MRQLYHMKSIGKIIRECNIQLDTTDPVTRGGFTQVPNFILKDPNLSVGAKLSYAMFLSYAWHNDSCFPGQDRLAADMGLSRSRVTELVSELSRAGLLTIQRRGQGRTNYYTVHFQVTGKGMTGRRALSDIQMSISRHQEVGLPTTSGQPADFTL
ncbi:MAG: helix-turn-helix domain-containing protein [Methylococcales bacterium]|nr:MAG: helix-turn-helix domain-containing protein [Methylococcales bacterium]